MARRLLLMRHARVPLAFQGKLIGSTDVALDRSGELQALAQTDRVARWAPQVCYSSPLRRCRQTAAAVVPELTVRFDAELREIDFGRLETRTFAEAAADDPGLTDRWATFAPDFAFPDGEDLAGFLRRVGAVAERLIRDPAATVLAVTHGGVIRAMICHLIGLDPRHYVAFHVPYAALAVIDLCDGQGVLAALEQPGEMEVGCG
ncbi:MAG: histidine phosphatase family protein [Planctomycetaceae bacterium]|nr:MAG: histidine phosphatase family protein [Planctomycetaceae bacterium]